MLTLITNSKATLPNTDFFCNSMLWFIFSALMLVDGIHQAAQKYLTHRFAATTITLTTFSISALAAVGWQLTRRHGILLPTQWFFISAVAFLNALAAWLYLHALRIHMTQTVLITPLTTVISIILLATFLHEWILLNPFTLHGLLKLLGIILTIGTLFCFATVRHFRPDQHISFRWLIYSAGAISIWGVVNFLLKYFSLHSVDSDLFLISWYPGAVLGTIAILLFSRIHLSTTKRTLSTTSTAFKPSSFSYLTLLILGSTTITSLAITYGALSKSSGIAILSADSISKTVTGALIGLFIFGEQRILRLREWLGVGLSILAVTLLSF